MTLHKIVKITKNIENFCNLARKLGLLSTILFVQYHRNSVLIQNPLIYHSNNVIEPLIVEISPLFLCRQKKTNIFHKFMISWSHFLRFFDNFWLLFHYNQSLDTKIELRSCRGMHRRALGPCSRCNFKVGQYWHFLTIFGYFWD